METVWDGDRKENNHVNSMLKFKWLENCHLNLLGIVVLIIYAGKEGI